MPSKKETGVLSGVNLPHMATLIFDTPLMIAPDKLQVILSALSSKMGLDVPTIKSGHVGDPSREKTYRVMNNGIAVIPIYGSLVHKVMGLDALSGLTSYESIEQMFSMAVEDSSVSGIVLDINSPGGEVNGVFDLVDTIYNARGIKPITAIANEQAYSAAYALASAADQIYTPRTGGVGSIGVIAAHVDQSKHDEMKGYKVTTVYAGDRKNDFNPHEPLSDKAMAVLQNHVNETNDLFIETVARNRNMTASEVRNTQAGLYRGKTAVESRLADKVASVNDALSSIAQSNSRRITMSDKTRADTGAAKNNTKATTEEDDTKANAEQPDAEVIDFNARIKQAEDAAKEKAMSDAKASAREITDLCKLAGLPQMAGELIASGMSMEEARKSLFDAQASMSDQTAIHGGHHLHQEQASDHGWGSAFAKLHGNHVNQK